MRRKFARCILIACPFALAVAASGQYLAYPWYPYNQIESPSPADLVTYSGVAKSIVVQILNLTPYTIRHGDYPLVPTAPPHPVLGPRHQTDKERHYPKTMVFAPVGIPHLIPAVPAAGFPDLPDYDPNYVNNVTRPYSMVFSWAEYGKDGDPTFGSRSAEYWTIEGVQYCVPDPSTGTCTKGAADVTLGLFMSRIGPKANPTAGFFQLLVGILKTGISMVKVAFNPANPLTWVKTFTGMNELADEARFLADQLAEDEAGKMYVSAYPVPAPSTPCFTDNSSVGCLPSAKYNDDATDAEWGPAIGGIAETQLVVTTHVLRGKKAVESWSAYANGPGSLGSLPIVMVTVIRAVDYVAAQVGTLAQSDMFQLGGPGTVNLTADVQANIAQLRRLLEKYNLAGLDALRALIAQLDPDERAIARQMAQSLMAGESLTNAQRQFLHRLIVDLRHALNEKEEG